MWFVQVIEVGTGKVLDGFGSRNRKEAETQRLALEMKYPNANIDLEYVS